MIYIYIYIIYDFHKPISLKMYCRKVVHIFAGDI